MAGERLRERILFLSGAVEMLVGAIMNAMPSLAAYWWLSWSLIAIGATTLVVALASLKGAVWEWLLDHAQKRASGVSGKQSRFPNVRAAESQSIRNMMGNEERTKLVGLLQSGDVTAWCRTVGDFEDLRPIDPALWQRKTLNFAEIGGAPQTLLATRSEIASRPWREAMAREPQLTTHYDVHFNRAQLSVFWPDIRF